MGDPGQGVSRSHLDHPARRGHLPGRVGATAVLVPAVDRDHRPDRTQRQAHARRAGEARELPRPFGTGSRRGQLAWLPVRPLVTAALYPAWVMHVFLPGLLDCSDVLEVAGDLPFGDRGGKVLDLP